MAKKVTKYRRVLRSTGKGYRYFRGTTLTYASPEFKTKAEAREWLKDPVKFKARRPYLKQSFNYKQISRILNRKKR